MNKITGQFIIIEANQKNVNNCLYNFDDSVFINKKLSFNTPLWKQKKQMCAMFVLSSLINYLNVHIFSIVDSRIIQCSGCRSTFHKSCYDPSITGAQFLCDSCQYSKNKKEFCFICGNKGLLKQVDDKFAHPICLLFSP